MAITAAMVKELREISGAGMMDCKKALTATEGDMDKAMEFLREKGLATAQKKASRIAAEGIVMLKVAEDSQKAVAVEVNAETDFDASSGWTGCSNRREHEDSSFPESRRRKRFCSFLYTYGWKNRCSG